MRKGFLLLMVFLASNIIYCQDFNAYETFMWAKEIFEKNDAGFQYVIDKKGKEEYQKHNEKFVEKIKKIKDKNEFVQVVNEWLRFFRKGHIGFEIQGQLTFGSNSNQNTTANSSQSDNEKIKKQFENWETYPYQENEFNAHISNIKEAGLEGIWASAVYKVGVKKVKNEYIGFIIDADGVFWSKSQIKFKIKEDNGKLNGVFYLKDHSSKEVKEVLSIGNNYMQFDDLITFKRIAPNLPENNSDLGYKYMMTERAIFEKLSEKTAILRVPSFEYSGKKEIDSLITANKEIILKTENLIIDLRNNGGGADRSYEKISPFIYTNPIRTPDVEFLSTAFNIKNFEDLGNKLGLKEVEADNGANYIADKLKQHIGEFVSLDSTDITITTLDSVYAFPKNVGVIINGGCASSAEQFLLVAKQSKKVKLFGTTTFGALDVSNWTIAYSPSDDFMLVYCLSRSKRIPDFAIDDIGIQPDYFIDKTIPVYDWVDFVRKSLEQ